MTTKRRKISRAEKADTIQAIAFAAIRRGLGTDAVLNAVKAAFPKAKTSKFCVAWYRSEMRRRGEKVPTPIRIVRKRAKEATHAAR